MNNDSIIVGSPDISVEDKHALEVIIADASSIFVKLDNNISMMKYYRKYQLIIMIVHVITILIALFSKFVGLEYWLICGTAIAYYIYNGYKTTKLSKERHILTASLEELRAQATKICDKYK